VGGGKRKEGELYAYIGRLLLSFLKSSRKGGEKKKRRKGERRFPTRNSPVKINFRTGSWLHSGKGRKKGRKKAKSRLLSIKRRGGGLNVKFECRDTRGKERKKKRGKGGTVLCLSSLHTRPAGTATVSRKGEKKKKKRRRGEEKGRKTVAAILRPLLGKKISIPERVGGGKGRKEEKKEERRNNLLPRRRLSNSPSYWGADLLSRRKCMFRIEGKEKGGKGEEKGRPFSFFF